MIYTNKYAFRFMKKSKDLIEIQDRVFEALPPTVYGKGCWAISSFVKERFGLDIILVALRTPTGDYTPHFINRTAAGNLVDLKQRVSVFRGKVIGQKRCGFKCGIDILPEGRTRMDYKLDPIPSDFSLAYRKDTFKEFRRLLKGKIDAPDWAVHIETLRQL